MAKKEKVIYTGCYGNWRDCVRPLEVLALLFVGRGKKEEKSNYYVFFIILKYRLKDVQFLIVVSL